MAQTFKSNPLVFLETPNEPHAAKDQTVQNQIAVINAIRASRVHQSDRPAAVARMGHVQPRRRCGGGRHAQTCSRRRTSMVATGRKVPSTTAKSLGMFSVIDEFGDAMDGVHIDAGGAATIAGVIAKNEAGQARRGLLGNGQREPRRRRGLCLPDPRWQSVDLDGESNSAVAFSPHDQAWRRHKPARHAAHSGHHWHRVGHAGARHVGGCLQRRRTVHRLGRRQAARRHVHHDGAARRRRQPELHLQG